MNLQRFFRMCSFFSNVSVSNAQFRVSPKALVMMVFVSAPQEIVPVTLDKFFGILDVTRKGYGLLGQLVVGKIRDAAFHAIQQVTLDAIDKSIIAMDQKVFSAIRHQSTFSFTSDRIKIY